MGFTGTPSTSEKRTPSKVSFPFFFLVEQPHIALLVNLLNLPALRRDRAVLPDRQGDSVLHPGLLRVLVVDQYVGHAPDLPARPEPVGGRRDQARPERVGRLLQLPLQKGKVTATAHPGRVRLGRPDEARRLARLRDVVRPLAGLSRLLRVPVAVLVPRDRQWVEGLLVHGAVDAASKAGEMEDHRVHALAE